MVFGCFGSIGEELRFRLVQARLRHVFGLCTGALFFFLGGSKGAVLEPPKVLFFAVPQPSVLLYLSSDLGVVCLFRRSCIFAIVQARLRHVFGLCTGALFFLGGSKGAVLDPPNVLFFAVPELGFRWCLAVSDPLARSCVFGLSRLGGAMFLVYVLGLFSSS